MNLDVLFQRADVWRGGETPPTVRGGMASGFAALDALLPGGGWPRGALSEVVAAEGHGALSLLMSALARQREEDRLLVFVAPPYLPYPPALTACGIDLAHVICVRLRGDDGSGVVRDESDRLWAIEQCLRSGACAAVLGWFARPPVQHLRRLQLAAEGSDSLACLFYPPDVREQTTPAALRLAVERQPGGLRIYILKRRGGWPCGPITLQWPETAAAALEPCDCIGNGQREGSFAGLASSEQGESRISPSGRNDRAWENRSEVALLKPRDHFEPLDTARSPRHQSRHFEPLYVDRDAEHSSCHVERSEKSLPSEESAPENDHAVDRTAPAATAA